MAKCNIVPFPKSGNIEEAGNYRGIAVSVIAAKMILNRIKPYIKPILRPNQNGFRPGRHTTSYYKIDFNEYFTLNKRNDRFILPLMKTTKYQNTIFFKGIKYYNDIIFGNILKKNKIKNINQLKKVMKLFFVNQYKI